MIIEEEINCRFRNPLGNPTSEFLAIDDTLKPMIEKLDAMQHALSKCRVSKINVFRRFQAFLSGFTALASSAHNHIATEK